MFLDVNWDLVWTIVNIGVLYLLIRRFLFAPIRRIIAQRTRAISDQIDEAKQRNDEAAQLKEERESQLADVHAQAVKILDEARRHGQEEYDKIVDDARRSARHAADEALARAEADRTRAMNEVKNRAADLVLTAAGKLAGKAMTDADEQAIVDAFCASEEARK